MKELFSVVGHMVIPEHEGKRLQLVLAENQKDVWQQAGSQTLGLFHAVSFSLDQARVD